MPVDNRQPREPGAFSGGMGIMSTSLHSYSDGRTKIAKPRTRTTVRPILKKLHSTTASDESGSLDLDRSWDEQPAQYTYMTSEWRSSHATCTEATTNEPYYVSRSSLDGPRYGLARDGGFTVSSPSTELGSTAPLRFTHTRSLSGTSYVSTATNNSGRRSGSFVHPFQQTPRTSTPPLLSRTASQSSLSRRSSSRTRSPMIPQDHTPSIPEDTGIASTATDRHYDGRTSLPLLSAFRAVQHSSKSGNHRRQTFSTHTSTSSATTPSSKTSPVLSGSAKVIASDIDGSAINCRSDVPPPGHSVLSSTAPSSAFPQIQTQTAVMDHVAAATPTSSLSPLRSSFDMSSFRIRSRSEVDAVTRQEQIREARRKWEEKESLKEEKYARDQVRRQERAHSKETHKVEKAHGHSTRKFRSSHHQQRQDDVGDGEDAGAGGRVRATSAVLKGSSSIGGGSTTHSNATMGTRAASLGFEDEDVVAGLDRTMTARADDVQFQSTKRKRNAKKRTTGAWTAFELWFRTGLYKMGR